MLDSISDKVLLYTINMYNKLVYSKDLKFTFDEDDTKALNITCENLVAVCDDLENAGYFKSVHISYDGWPDVVLTHKAFSYKEFKQFEEAQTKKQLEAEKHQQKIQLHNIIHQWINTAIAVASLIATVFKILLE